MNSYQIHQSRRIGKDFSHWTLASFLLDAYARKPSSYLFQTYRLLCGTTMYVKLAIVARFSSICPTTPESHTQLAILMREVKHMLRKIRWLNNAADFNSPLFFDEFSYWVEKLWWELNFELVFCTKSLFAYNLTSEYHLYCHVMRRIKHASVFLVSPFFSYIRRRPFIDFGENRIFRHCW